MVRMWIRASGLLAVRRDLSIRPPRTIQETTHKVACGPPTYIHLPIILRIFFAQRTLFEDHPRSLSWDLSFGRFGLGPTGLAVKV